MMTLDKLMYNSIEMYILKEALVSIEAGSEMTQS